MIEALIALPILFALLVGVSFMRELYGARQAVLAEARRCALSYAAAGCGGEAPDGCEGIVGPGPRVGDDAQSTTLLDATRAAYAGSAFQLLESVPVLGDALSGLFGTTTQARAQRSVPGPGLAREPLLVKGGMLLLCDERPVGVLELAKQAVCNSPLLDGLDFLDLCEDL